MFYRSIENLKTFPPEQHKAVELADDWLLANKKKEGIFNVHGDGMKPSSGDTITLGGIEFPRCGSFTRPLMVSEGGGHYHYTVYVYSS